jgi:hypothetical protein
MKKRISTLTASLLVVAGTMLAQNETDALRYSQLGFGGTARYSSMGGSFGALGADFSTLSSNPAGIGVYRRSELTFSPGFMYQSATSTYTGMSADDQKAKLTMNNAGLVYAHNLDREGNSTGWKFIQFGFGVNRLANYNSQTTTTGVSSGSIMDQFKSQALGNAPANLDQFGAQLAYNTYLIDTVAGAGHGSPSTSYYEAINTNDKVNQTRTVNTGGSYNEMVITLGGNYNNKFFLGGTIGVPIINYTENSSYVETSVPGNTSTFSSLTYNNNLTTSGSGFNFKLGAIYKPVEFLRVGLAVHSKTWLSLHDSYDADMTAAYTGADQGLSGQWFSPNGSYNYSITTPGRIIGSVAGILGKMAVVNVDYESVDYSQARLSSADAGTFSEANANAKANFTRASIIRVGGEVKLKPLALRLGYAYYQSPYKTSGNDDTRNSFTGGIGFHHKKVFLDMAYILTLSNTKSYLYNPSFNIDGPAMNSNSVSTYMITLGVKL